ncbi:SPOR domain-containing protein [Colwellia sp. MEBiC06753]
MSTPFQNRLVGTIIVAAAVIIFLPDILDGEKESYQVDFEAIPQAPAFQGATEHKPFPQEKLANLPTESLADETAVDENEDFNIEPEQGGEQLQSTALSSGNNEAKTADVEKAESKLESVATERKVVTVTAKPAKDSYAWVIHLGSFKHQKNVDELMRKLTAAGYTAFTQPIKTKKGVLTKVIVGPELNKSDLEQKLPDLKKLTKVQGRLARFKVTK